MRLFVGSLMFVSLSTLSPGDQIPAGFKVDRYECVWKRNPFTLAAPAGSQAQRPVFEKLFLVSWLRDGSNEVIFVQNSETDEVQKITGEPNQNNLRLIQIQPDSNPQLVTAVISDGKTQGPVKFRLDAQLGPGQAASGVAPMPQIPNKGTTAQASNPTKVNPPMVPSSSANQLNAQILGLPLSPPIKQAATSHFHPGLLRVRREGGSGQAPLPAVVSDAEDGR
jgi:hypothetical protein